MSEHVRPENYNALSKFFHWIIALMIISLIGVGFYMSAMDPAPLKYQIYGLHKGFGITVLWLVGLRIIWRALTKTPKSLDTHATWEKYLSKTVHVLLYFGMIALPLSGWMMSSAGGHPVNYFGLFEVPPLVEKGNPIGKIAHQVHEYGGYALYIAIGLHFIGAAKHHIMDKDATVKRMGGNTVFLIIAGLMLLGIAGVIANNQISNFTQAIEKTAIEKQNE